MFVRHTSILGLELEPPPPHFAKIRHHSTNTTTLKCPIEEK
jgi:hypothetical protein